MKSEFSAVTSSNKSEGLKSPVLEQRREVTKSPILLNQQNIFYSEVDNEESSIKIDNLQVNDSVKWKVHDLTKSNDDQ